MANNSTLNTLGRKICDVDYLGFTPTSNSTKPPHIANGLFRECTGTTCDTSDFHKWLIDEQKKGAKSTQEIISEYKDILGKGEKVNESKVRQFRALLNELFNPDNTAYPSETESSYNISSQWLLKKYVKAEGGIGKFIYNILSYQLDGKKSPMLDLINDSVKNGSDCFTKLILPIIIYPTKDEKLVTTSLDEAKGSLDNWKKFIRKGFDILAENLRAIGESKNPLMVQERAICFSCFSIFLYLANSNSALYGGKTAPIFIDAGINLESIKKASEQTFTLAKTSVEYFYINSIKKILLQEGIKDSDNSCIQYIEEMRYDHSKSSEEIGPKIKEQYDGLRKDASCIDALAQALQFALYTFVYKNNTPSDFCRVMGIRSGLVGPKGNRTKIKRYIIDSFLLETIVLSVMERDDLFEGLEVREVAKKITESYGILFGFNDEKEFSILEDNNITKSTPGDLRGDMVLNSQRISDVFISLGLGHRFADGVTILKWNS